MPDTLKDAQLRDQIAAVNARDADRIKALSERFSHDDGFIHKSIGEYRARLGLGDTARYTEDSGHDARGFYQDGAQTFLQVLREHPVLHEERRLVAGSPIFGDSNDPNLAEMARDASGLLAAGALAMGFLGVYDDPLVDALTHVAFSADAISTLLRHVLGNKRIPSLEDLLRIAEHLEGLSRHHCVAGVMHALHRFAEAVASSRANSWSTGIQQLQPNYGCGGDLITIQGIGFGPTQPSGVQLWFPSLNGKCTPAQIAPRVTSPFAPQWSDTRIVAIAPANVGSGYVGFVGLSAAGAPLAGPASALAGEMQQCLGQTAFSASQSIVTIANAALFVPCPPGLQNGANYFRGGPPVVEVFSISPVVGELSGSTGNYALYVEPDTDLTLDWRVDNATSVRVRRVTPDGPFIDVTGPVRASRNIGRFAGGTPSMAIYRLTAANACGTVNRDIAIWLRKTPALQILGVEVIQSIQHFSLADPSVNNTVRLVANKRTVVRLYVDSGMRDGFDNGTGANRQPQVTGSVSVWPSAAYMGFDAALANPSGADFEAKPGYEIDRGTLTDTMNFELPVAQLSGTVRIEARVWVQGHRNEVGTGWYTYDLHTVVNFESRRTQRLMRILVRDDDPRRMLAAPTADEYTATMQGATTRYPIAEDGFVVAIPPGFEEITTAIGGYDFGSTYRHTEEDCDLTIFDGWTRLLDHIEWIAGQFPNQGEIWTALVPNGLYGGIAGLGHSSWTNSGRPVNKHRALVTMNAFLSGFAHELGHTFAPPGTGAAHMQIGHAPCPPAGDPAAPGNVDGRLPPYTDEMGMDVAGMMLIPSGAAETMGYCFPDPRWPSTAFWDMVFDELI